MVKIDYDSLLSKYDKIREEEAKKQEQKDENFVKSVFGQGPSGSKVKRILNDDSSDEDMPRTKVIRPEKPTDFLASKEEKNSTSTSWNKSIGSIGKNYLKKNLLVKPKKSESTEQSTKNQTEQVMTSKPSTNSLSLIAGYSDTDSE